MNKIYHYVQIYTRKAYKTLQPPVLEDHLLVFMVLTWFKPYAQYVHIFSVLYRLGAGTMGNYFEGL